MDDERTAMVRVPAGATIGGRLTPRRITLLVVLLGLTWRVVRYCLAFPLWGDEAFLAINFLTRGFAGLARPLEFGQVAPPGFLWIELAAARTLGTSERALRLVPFLAGIVSLGLFWRFCRAVATRRVTAVAVALFAASFFPVRHATEVKPYSLDLLVALVVTSLGWSTWRAPGDLRRWLALGAAGLVGVWCSYTAVFPIAAVGLLLLGRGWAERSAPTLARAAAFALVTGSSWAAMVLVFARAQLEEARYMGSLWTWGFPPLSRPWRLPYWLLEVHTSSMMAYPYGGRSFTGTATALLVAVGAYALWRKSPRRPLLWLLLGPLPVALTAATLRRYPYGVSTRLTLYLAPAVCLLAAEGIVALLRARRRAGRGSIHAALAFALIPIVCTACDLRAPYRRRDDLAYREFARRLAAQAAPGDRFVVFDGADAVPREAWVMNSIWVQRVARLRYYLLSLAPVPTQWGVDPHQIEPSPTGRTWLILHEHGFKPIYPHARRASYEPTLAARLGPARSTRHRLPVGSTVEIHVFQPPGPLVTAGRPRGDALRTR